MTDLFDMIEELEREEKPEIIVRAPFAYPGSKGRSIDFLLENVPNGKVYVEPFGGSGALLLARKPAKLEVYNDRFGGVVCFYRCIRDREKLENLIERLEFTIHAREEFIWSWKTWQEVEDEVERAARWYYSVIYSFGSNGRSWGRATKATAGLAGRIHNKLPEFYNLHQRLRNVQIDNRDWRECIADYDSPDTVFYLDPPYVDAFVGTYKHELSQDDHRQMLEFVFRLKGCACVSGYSNPLYEEQDWDERYEVQVMQSIRGMGETDGKNPNPGKDAKGQRGLVTEILWIKR